MLRDRQHQDQAVRNLPLNGFIDIHTHILPGVDDGARTLEESLALLDVARQSGTRALVLTPHYRGKYKTCTPGLLREQFSLLQEAAGQKFPELQLYLGQEIFFETDIPDALSAGRILLLNGSHYVLLEFSPGSLRSQIIRGVSETVLSGCTPIIAHAERYSIFRKDSTLVDEVLHMGALIQLNADSILGSHGFGVKHCCHKLLRQGKAHFIASDAHDLTHRTPQLRECFLHIHKKFGQEYAARLFSENALAVINHTVL
jgi:protein-tyrosine phosphatase